MIDFLGVGPERTGTSTLWRILQKHPQVSFPVKPWHINYPNARPEKNIKTIYWYDWKNFDPADKEVYESHWEDGIVKGEISGTYFNFADRVFSVYPDVKVIVTWRNPVDRFFSHLALLNDQLFVRKFPPYILSYVIDPHHSFSDTESYIKNFISTHTPESFIESVNQCLLNGVENRFVDAALDLGLNYRLDEWRNKSKNLLIIKSEDLYHNQQVTIDSVTDFLNVDRITLPNLMHYNSKPKFSVCDEAYQKVIEYYADNILMEKNNAL